MFENKKFSLLLSIGMIVSVVIHLAYTICSEMVLVNFRAVENVAKFNPTPDNINIFAMYISGLILFNTTYIIVLNKLMGYLVKKEIPLLGNNYTLVLRYAQNTYDLYRFAIYFSFRNILAFIICGYALWSQGLIGYTLFLIGPIVTMIIYIHGRKNNDCKKQKSISDILSGNSNNVVDAIDKIVVAYIGRELSEYLNWYISAIMCMYLYAILPLQEATLVVVMLQAMLSSIGNLFGNYSNTCEAMYVIQQTQKDIGKTKEKANFDKALDQIKIMVLTDDVIALNQQVVDMKSRIKELEEQLKELQLKVK